MFTEKSLESYKTYIINEWSTELHSREIHNYMDKVRECVKRHGEDATDYDLANWEKITELKYHLAKDTLERKSLLTQAREALEAKNYSLASDLQIELQQKMEELQNLYSTYKRNLF